MLIGFIGLVPGARADWRQDLFEWLRLVSGALFWGLLFQREVVGTLRRAFYGQMETPYVEPAQTLLIEFFLPEIKEEFHHGQLF